MINWLNIKRPWFKFGAINFLFISILTTLIYSNFLLIKKFHTLGFANSKFEQYKVLIQKLPELKKYETSLLKTVEEYQLNTNELSLGEVTEIIHTKLNHNKCLLTKMEVGENTSTLKVFQIKLNCLVFNFYQFQKSIESSKEIFSIDYLAINKGKTGQIKQELTISHHQGGSK